jgi:RNA polymerase sigma-70 factor (ECF subfamily)
VPGASRFGSRAASGEPKSAESTTKENAMNPTRPLAPAASDALSEARAPLDPEALFRAYAPYVAKVAHQLLGRDDEVDDVIQDVFMAAVRGVHQVRDPGAIKGWLASIAIRSARRRLRFRSLRNLFSNEPPHEYAAVVDPAASPEQRALMARAYRVLDSLPVNERLAWVLRHIEGEGLERVALLCGCSLATVKRRITRASGVLQEALSDE